MFDRSVSKSTRSSNLINYSGGKQTVHGGNATQYVIRSFGNRHNGDRVEKATSVSGIIPFAFPSSGNGGGVAGNEYACGQRNAYGRD